MALTRKQLRDMGLTAQQVDEIIAAHIDSVEAAKTALAEESNELRAQLEGLRTSSQQEKEALQAAFDGYRAAATRKDKLALMTEALKAAGANPAAAPLLAEHAALDGMNIESGVLTGAAEAVDSMKAQWAELFTAQTTEALPTLDPLGRKTGPLTLKDVEGMTEADINRHWAQVSGLLQKQ